jgi:CRP-like cAMP-binding protein
VPVDLFAAVPPRDLQLAGRRRSFARDEVVFHRDDPGDSVHRVVSGRFAARIATAAGEGATLALYGPGEVFGLLAVIGEVDRRTATVVALERAETLSVAGSVFRRLRREHPPVAAAVEALLVEQLVATNERLVEALYTSAPARVRARLRSLAELYGDGAGGPVTIPLSQEHLAGLAGTTRETVNRVLNEEVGRGTVRLARRRITVVGDPA